MGATIWGIHAGSYGEADRHFMARENPCIALGWECMGDLSKIPDDHEEFKKRVSEAYPQMKKGAIPTTAGMLRRFAYEMSIGDFVVYPSKQDKLVHIGKIAGDYVYDPKKISEFPSQRRVQWLKHAARTSLSQGALYEIGSAMSLFLVKNYADEYLTLLQSGGSGGAAQVVADDATVADVAEDIEQNTRDFILKRLYSELKGYPFESFVAHLLNVIGYKTRVTQKRGDGGIDIIAYKDELGIEPPIVKVQVKCIDGSVAPSMVQALYGNIEPGEYGLFVTPGNFTKQAVSFAGGKANLRLIDGEELVDLILCHYEKFDSKYKAMIPLKNVYIPTQINEAP